MKKIYVLLLSLAALSGVAENLRAEISIDQLVQQARINEGDVAVRDLPRWNAARKILVNDDGYDLSQLSAANPGVEFIEVQSVAEAMKHASEVDAIVGFCNPKMIAAARNLVWVQLYWAGAERCLPVEDIASGAVILTNMQKMSSPVIAEHAIAMMLSLARNLPGFTREMIAAKWSSNDTATNGMTPIAGKNLLVAGLGGIGTEVARLGNALGMTVSGTRNSSRTGPDFVEYVGLSHELNSMASKADVVVNALPLTDATSGTFDDEFFATIKEGAIFINVGRGGTVVTEDLLDALESGRVSGAGLDVTDPEPLPASHSLWQRDDVIITPHVAGFGGEQERHGVLLIENLRRYIAGDALLNVVDPKKGY
jgi:phosphoglycerate dehydrogenase-like enzyme